MPAIRTCSSVKVTFVSDDPDSNIFVLPLQSRLLLFVGICFFFFHTEEALVNTAFIGIKSLEQYALFY